MRATIGPDAHHLKDVRCLFGRAQCEEVVRVVATPVAVERCEHRHHRVRGCERAAIAARGRRRQRPARQLAAWFDVAADPVRSRHPGEQQRHLHRIGAVRRRRHARRRRAPPRARRAGSGSGRSARRAAAGSSCAPGSRTLKALHCLAPVALDLLRLTFELLDPGGSQSRGDRAARPRARLRPGRRRAMSCPALRAVAAS